MKKKYAKKEDIPKGLESYYEEKDGTFIRIDSKIEGIKSIEDFETVQSDLTKAEAKVKELETSFEPFKDMDAKEISKSLAEFEALKASKDGKPDENTQELINLKVENAELKRNNEKLLNDYTTSTEKLTTLESERLASKRNKALRDFYYNEEKKTNSINDYSIPDLEEKAERDLEWNEAKGCFITKDDKKLPLSDWATEISTKRGYFKTSKGSNDIGSGNTIRNASSGDKPVLLKGAELVAASLATD